MLKIFLTTKIIVKVSYFRNFTKFEFQNFEKHKINLLNFYRMKKIILLLLISFFSFSGYSQLALEGFESGIPSTWAVFDNGVGTNQSWGINNAVATPPTVYQGNNAAYINRENLGTEGLTSQDYLATPLVTIPTNGQIRFFTRSFANGNQGTKYQIRVAPSTASQTNPSAYVLVQEWDETSLNATFNIYEEKIVSLSAYANQQVYVSFVRVHTQLAGGINGAGDRWLVDNVSIVQQCLDPTGLAANGITQTSANLTWGNPSGATSWEIEVIPATGTPTGVGTFYNGTLPYAVTATTAGAAFTPSTDYKYFVRALCSSGASSLWVGPFPFSTSTPGISCTAPIVVTSLPFFTTDNTANYSDNPAIEGSPGASGCGSTNGFLNGNDVVYSYTATTTGVINVSMTPSDTFSGIFAYNSCANIGVSCINGVANSSTDVRAFDLPVTAGSTYYFVISTWAAPQTTAYTLTIQAVNCAPPTTLSASSIFQTSAQLSWANPGGATSWEVAVQTAGSAIPSGSGVTANTNSNYLVTGLTQSTAYQYYVRADCGNSTFSAWAGPFPFNTQCGAFNVPFQEGFNSTSTTQTCWTVLNVNNDTDTWNMDFTTNPFEGNQAAAISTDFNAGANNDWLISPQIILNGNQRLKFHYRVQSASEPNDFRVMLSTTGNAPANFTNTLIPLSTYNNTAYAQKIVSLSGYTGPVNIAWQVPAGGLDGWRLYIDNVIIEDLPTCPEPTALASSNVLSTSATVSWTNGNTESAWQVLALPCGSTAPSAGTTGFINTTSNPYNFIGLTPATCYDVYVRAFCLTSDSSPWSGPITFTTQCGAFNVPFQEGFNSTSTTQSCWTVLNVNNDFDTWNMDYTTNPFEGNEVAAISTDFNAGANNDWLISPQIILNGNQRLKFHYRVQSASEPNDFRVMISTTGNAPANLTNTLIPLSTYSNTSYAQKIVSLAGYSGPVNIAWQVPAGGLDGWRLYIDNVIIEDLPPCLEPTGLTATEVTSTSALLGWTEPSTSVTQWEVLVVPFGSSAPTQSSTGAIVSVNPVLYTGLNPGNQYTFYVRGICTTTGTSEWSSGVNFTTLIINDNCSGAIFAPVNQSSICQQVTPGTINGATASPPAPIAPCLGTADDDVWFQFVASNPFLSVSLQNIVGTTTNLNFAIYSGSCGTLTQVFCSAALTTSGIVNGLTLGQTYYIRVYSNSSTPQDVNFNLCISTPASCISGQGACQNLSYQNTTGVDDQGDIGCLLSSPNPSYYTINVLTSGPINLLLTQSTTQGGAPNLDVDYAAWGPFPSQAAACAAIGNPPTLTPGIGVPISQTTGCSFSIAATETLNIVNAVAGQVYVILITNFSDDPGYISLSQTNATSPGAGFYECCLDAYFNYNPVSYCKSPGAQNPIAVVSQGSVAGDFTLSSASPTGLVFANSSTGEINLAASSPGNYLVLNTVAATSTCAEKQRGYNISIVEPTTATISYNSTTYCKSNTSLQNVNISGATGGTFSAIPNVGLSINPANGTINPSLSSPGIYNVIYSLPGTGVCSLGNPSTQVEIIGVPNIPQPAAVSVCNTYTLPVLSVGSYYSQSGGLGIPIDITAPITSPQTIYVYVNNNGCTNEKSFTVTINAAPIPTLNVTQPTCAIPTGTIEVTSPLNGSGSGLPANLFISEVTDAPNGLGALTYVEIYNGTGSPVDLSNYKLNTYNNGSATVNSSCDNALSGIINNNSTVVIAIGSASNQGGVIPNLVFSGCNGVNNNDNIRLTKVDTGLDIDLWGDTAGVSFTPLGQPGYTYRRLPTASVPSLTWNPADWFIIDDVASVVDYSNIGQHTLSASNYEYSLDNGTYQLGTTFAGVAPGNHTIKVHDLVTGCYSNSESVTINAVTLTPTVLGFSYTTPVCKNNTTNPTPITDSGFTTGGEFSATPAGLIIDANSGLINLATSAPGAYTVSYHVNPNNSICLAGGTSTASITIKSMVTLGTNISYASPFCFGGSNPLPNTSSIGFTSGGIYSSTTGLNINPNTGEIDLGNSSAGSYSITYTVVANAANCELTTPSTTTVVITAPVQINVESGCQSNNYILTALPIDNSFNLETATYTWRNGSGQVVGTNTQSITVTETGSYTVTVTTNGCSSVSLPVSVDSINCVIQKGISVNNDGKNDTFDLSGFNVKKLTIFNRYGLKVYDKNDYTNEWGGQSNTGDELPDGTYYYVIARDNGQNKSGWIYINRAQ